MKKVRMDWGVTVKSLWWGFYLELSPDGFAIPGSVCVSLFFLRCRYQERSVSLSVDLKCWSITKVDFQRADTCFLKISIFQMSEMKYLEANVPASFILICFKKLCWYEMCFVFPVKLDYGCNDDLVWRQSKTEKKEITSSFPSLEMMNILIFNRSVCSEVELD